jgi:hypothetical protein
VGFVVKLGDAAEVVAVFHADILQLAIEGGIGRGAANGQTGAAIVLALREQAMGGYARVAVELPPMVHAVGEAAAKNAAIGLAKIIELVLDAIWKKYVGQPQPPQVGSANVDSATRAVGTETAWQGAVAGAGVAHKIVVTKLIFEGVGAGAVSVGYKKLV